MKKEVFELLKKEMKSVFSILLVLIVLFKVVFFKEDILVVLKIVLSIFWMFMLPGYVIMIYWSGKLDFIERLIIGTALSTAIMGVFSYYLGLAGLHIKYHTFILPLATIIFGFIAAIKKKKD